MFGLSSFYQYSVVHRSAAVFYLCGGNSDRQERFDQSKISNYSRQYVELKLQIF